MWSMPPSAFATAMIPISGRPTPVSRKPSDDQPNLSPKSLPSVGGKIRLPAPKNMAKRANPRMIDVLLLVRMALFKRVAQT